MPSKCLHRKKKSWRDWFILFEKTNKLIKFNLGETLNTSWKFHSIFVGYVIFLTIWRALLYTVGEENNTFVMDIIRYISLTFNYLLIRFSMVLLNGFKILNKYAPNLRNDCGLRLNIIANMNREQTVLVKIIYKKLYKMSVCFNHLFGWLFIMSLIHCLITLWSFTQFLINLSRTKILDFQPTLLSVISAAYYLVSKLFFIQYVLVVNNLHLWIYRAATILSCNFTNR